MKQEERRKTNQRYFWDEVESGEHGFADNLPNSSKHNSSSTHIKEAERGTSSIKVIYFKVSKAVQSSHLQNNGMSNDKSLKISHLTVLCERKSY